MKIVAIDINFPLKNPQPGANWFFLLPSIENQTRFHFFCISHKYTCIFRFGLFVFFFPQPVQKSVGVQPKPIQSAAFLECSVIIAFFRFGYTRRAFSDRRHLYAATVKDRQLQNISSVNLCGAFNEISNPSDLDAIITNLPTRNIVVHI